VRSTVAAALSLSLESEGRRRRCFSGSTAPGAVDHGGEGKQQPESRFHSRNTGVESNSRKESMKKKKERREQSD
jgi:hypothetical protein